jgi:hypothetical protein
MCSRYFPHRFACLSLIFGSFVPLTFAAEPPDWWALRGAVDSSADPDDYAAANIGQMKTLAAQAAAEMDIVYEPIGGAGPPITALINSWLADQPPGVLRDDYAVLNQGQLKAPTMSSDACKR